MGLFEQGAGNGSRGGQVILHLCGKEKRACGRVFSCLGGVSAHCRATPDGFGIGDCAEENRGCFGAHQRVQPGAFAVPTRRRSTPRLSSWYGKAWGFSSCMPDTTAVMQIK
ncbi:Hypothetical Protein RRSL_02698 [Ralstonia solanacearum UW551]|uniref:Uncharacterized protein n=1 Tax=Ralstonia solanacearum (strain UW551) TaxID=342110 RepID=A0AB33VIA1_RALSU|nr:Hypothetical Protein RRSL_02698 [Ralstonia solanacearum UW551]